jgi:hypothetical protein
MSRKRAMHAVTLLELAQGRVRLADIDRASGCVTSRAEGAFANESRVRKVTFEDGDFHPIGAMATVIGSVGLIEGEFGYFVRWDDFPEPVFIRGRKLELAS